MENIQVWSIDSPEYQMLETVANLLTRFSKHHIIYKVRNTYFDFGQDWKWTTLIVDDEGKYGGYQVSPVEQKEIITCDTPYKLTTILNYYLDKEEVDYKRGFYED